MQKRTIDEVEEHLDDLLENLEVYRWPMQEVLWRTLSLAQRTVDGFTGVDIPPFAYLEGVIVEKKTLEILLPWLYRKCRIQQWGSTQPEAHVEKMSMDILHAFVYSKRYHSASVVFPQYHQGRLNADLVDRTITFKYPSKEVERFVYLDRILRGRLDERLIKRTIESGSYEDIYRPEIVSQLGEAFTGTDLTTFGDTVGDTAYTAARRIIQTQLLEPQISPDVWCGSYTVGEAYDVWIELKTLTLMYQLARIESKENLPVDEYIRRSVCDLRPAEFAYFIAGTTGIKKAIIKSIFDDLLFDPSVGRPDPVIRPFYPLPGKERVLCVPFVIDTNDWETCLLRNLATKDQGSYGKTIAKHKITPLSDKLAETFESGGFRATRRIELHDEEGGVVGEIDVAVLNVSECRVDLIEVKWLIPPDSTSEDIQANREIEGGRSQLTDLFELCESKRRHYITQLFPGLNDSVVDTLKVHGYVLCRGTVGWTPMEKPPLVIDYDEVLNHLSSSSYPTLQGLWDDVVSFHNQIAPPKNTLSSMAVHLGGIILDCPAIPTMNLESNESRRVLEVPKVGRNQPCGCGSGVKYKRCCLGL